MAREQKKITSPDMSEQELRDLIAWRIADERRKKYPGRGGAKKCAEDIDIIYQQWSQYENGARKPKLQKLQEIADFFNVPMEHFTTLPDQWNEKRHAWKNRVKPGKQSRNYVADTVNVLPAPRGNDFKNATGAIMTESGTETHSAILGIIGKLLQVDKMHERGEIPTPVYKQTLEAIERFTDIANAHKTET